MSASVWLCRGRDVRLILGIALGWLAAAWVIVLCAWVAVAWGYSPKALVWIGGLPLVTVLAAVQLTRGRPVWALGGGCVLLVFSMLAVWTVGVFVAPAPFVLMGGAILVWWAIGWAPGI